MEGFGKIAGVGLASIFGIVVMTSMAGVSLGMPVSDFQFSADGIQGRGLNLYAGTISENSGELGKIFIELDGADIAEMCISKEMSIGGLTVRAIVKGSSAEAMSVLMKCENFMATTMAAENLGMGPSGDKEFATTADVLNVKNVRAWVSHMNVGSIDLNDLVIKLEIV